MTTDVAVTMDVSLHFVRANLVFVKSYYLRTTSWPGESRSIYIYIYGLDTYIYIYICKLAENENDDPIVIRFIDENALSRSLEPHGHE